MDIRKWLAETEHPVPWKQPDVEPFLLPRQPVPVLNTRRKRARTESDSSLLKAPSLQPRRKGESAIKRDRHDARDAADMAPSFVSHSTRSESTSSSTTSQHYARKPRCKTRPDRYEARSKKGKGRDTNAQRSERRELKRKFRRKKAVRTHSGLGQKLCAKNVSKDRLTLKPLEKMGLFGNGRTSTSIKGRGLPDLVFSEMKFLRNSHGGIEHSAQAPDVRKKRKKDHARTKQEDISAFFTSVRPTPTDPDENAATKSGCQTSTKATAETDRCERVREQSAVLDTAMHTVKSEGRTSYLTLGGRGLRGESTSYFSWSESVRAPSAAPACCKDVSTVHGKCFDIGDRETEEVAHSRHALVRQRESSSVVCKPMGASAERLRMSPVAPVRSGLFRSQSLPQCSSSPRQPSFVGRGLNRRTTEDVTSSSSMPPTSRVRGNAEYQEVSIADSSRRARSVMASSTSEDAPSAHKRTSRDAVKKSGPQQSPQESSSLRGVLQYCNDASQAERQRAAIRKSHRAEAGFSTGHDNRIQQCRGVSYQRTAQVPTVRFPAVDPQPSQSPNFCGPSFYGQQEQRQHLPKHSASEEDYGFQHPNTGGQGYVRETGYLDQEDLGGILEEPVSYELTGDFDADSAGLGYVVDDAEQFQEPETTNVKGSSFWRPNRLY